MTVRTRQATVECRASDDRSTAGRIYGVLVETGRMASKTVREIIVPGALKWAGNGVALRAEHLGREVMRFIPKVDGNKIVIDDHLPDTAIGREVADNIRSGRQRELSIEYVATRSADVQGVEEVLDGMLLGVTPCVAGCFGAQATVSVREASKRREYPWL